MEADDLPPILAQKESDAHTRLRKSLHSDINLLLSTFFTHKHKDFAAFKACWDHVDFELVLLCRPDDCTYDWYMDCLFDETLGTFEGLVLRILIFLQILWCKRNMRSGRLVVYI